MVDLANPEPHGSLSDSGFFVVRTPLLPVEELLSWSEGLEAHSSFGAGAEPDTLKDRWESDVSTLRARLRAILDRREIRQALFIASPDLRAGLDHWRQDPDSKNGLQAERAIVKYFERMCTRPTPFGLFSGWSLGVVSNAPDTTILLQPRSAYKTSSRLDFDYLFRLSAALRRDDALAEELTYWPNSSLRRVASAWHYTESRVSGVNRSHHLVKLEDDPFLVAAIERATAGAGVADLVRAITSTDTEDPASEEEARDYVRELISNDVLVPELTPLVTGVQPLDDLIRQLGSLPAGARTAEILQEVKLALLTLDSEPLGSGPEPYEAVEANLKRLPAQTDPAKLFQVDLRKPVHVAHLGKAVIEEIIRATEVLTRFAQPREPEVLSNFRQAFSERYDRAMVPLLEALDEETGLAFGAQPDADGPLLRGLDYLEPKPGSPGNDIGLEALLVRRLGRLESDANRELELTEAELPGSPASHGLPDSFCLVAMLVGQPAALKDGDFQIVIRGGIGPSGARMFGRFCHSDPELERCVRRHLRQEELHDPHAVYAEVVYVPEGRLGNVICRPHLRDYEIPYLARSGAPADLQLPASDLLIGIEGGRLVLRSGRLGKRVIPRVSNAHGFMNPSLPAIYRLLCYMQQQDGKHVPSFSWGPTLEARDFLPRVRIGRTVLSLARWTLSGAEIKTLTQPSRSARFSAMQRLRTERRLPRWIGYHQADNVLPADLDNPLSVDVLTQLLKGSRTVYLTELLPDPGALCVHGDEGHFCHELNIPMIVRPQVQSVEASTPHETKAPPSVPIQRRFRRLPLGSEWVYVKLYGGSVVLDELLHRTLLPLVEKAAALGALFRWFFVRYSDPHEHLRIRFNGSPERLHHDLLPILNATFYPLLAEGAIWKVQFDTYDREVERYGGPDAITLAEDYFFADSAAALSIFHSSMGDEGQDARWRAALYGVDRLLSDFGFEIDARRVLVKRWRDQRYSGSPPRQQLADKLRSERKPLEDLLWGPRVADGNMEFARLAFDERTRKVAGVVAQLHSLEASGKLGVDIAGLVQSYAHMHINRMIRFAANAHELVIYDFLARLYEAQIARRRSGTAPLRT